MVVARMPRILHPVIQAWVEQILSLEEDVIREDGYSLQVTLRAADGRALGGPWVSIRRG